jgi:transcriptional regulator with XRE-family HTH domain
MRQFDNIARLVRHRRAGHPKAYSQAKLSKVLGYKNGQFISNVERGYCSIPLKSVGKLAAVLDIPVSEIKIALLSDYESTIDNHIESAKTSESTLTS